MAKPVAWSFSALSAFETCAFQFYNYKVGKLFADTMGPEAAHGNYVHECLDKRISQGRPLPADIAHYEPYAARFVNSTGQVFAERKLALNKALEPVAFFARDVWVRGIIDVSILKGERGAAWDWKTGKRKLDDDQLRLFAGMLFAVHPELQEVSTGYIWLPTKQLDKGHFTRDQVPEIWGGFLPRVQRLERAHADNNWPKKPSGLCKKHCAVLSCEYNGRRGG